MFPLYQAHYKRVYSGGSLWANLFFLICLLSIGGVPFVIGWFMENFWSEDNYFYQRPNVSFTGRGALHVTTTEGNEYVWTTSPEFNDMFITGSALEIVPFFSVLEEETDGDRRPDRFYFTISIPTDLSGQRGEGVEKIMFLPELQYDIRHYLAHITLLTAPLLTFERDPCEAEGGPIAAQTAGEINFYSTERITGRAKYRSLESPLGQLKELAPLRNLEYFHRLYSREKQTIQFRPYEQTKGGLSVLPHDQRSVYDADLLYLFTWNIQLDVNDAVIYYKPTDAEALKWVLVQYFVIGFLIQWVVWNIRGCFVTRGIIATNAKEGVNEVAA